MAPFIRIALRYLTVPLLLFGLINESEAADIVADPDLLQWVSLGLGTIAPFIAEGWYWLARRFGWSK
ncbi:MAG: hypothetical protein IT552_12385 [Sphingomonadaceae bacterium]|nr:hypothetical protein [Sphingomonadaceae bacterium]